MNDRQIEEKVMKKIYTTLFAAAAIVAAAVSCGKAESEAVPEGGGELKVNISVAPLGPDTKAIKTNWAEGDIINIWFDVSPNAGRQAAEGPDLKLTRNSSGKWDASELKSGVQENLKAEGVIYGFWEGSNFCFNSSSSWFRSGSHAQFPGYYYDKHQTTDGDTGYLAASFSKVKYTYVSDKNELNADISGWSFGDADLQIVVTGITHAEGRYSLYSNEVSCLKRIEVGMSDGECKVTTDANAKGTAGHIAGIPNGDGVAFVGHIIDNAQKDYTFYLLDNSTNKKYSFKKDNIKFDSEGGKKVVGVKIAFTSFGEVSD